MRIAKAVGGPQKPLSKETFVEAQLDNGGRERPVWAAAVMLAASTVVILLILIIVSYCSDISLLRLCGPDDEVYTPVWDKPEPSIVPHGAWSLSPQGKTPELLHPTPYVVVKHTASARCYNFLDCKRLLREIRRRSHSKYSSNNFWIDSNGKIYEDHGWNSTNPSEGSLKRCNIDVSLIGNYMKHNMTKEMSSALRWLLQEGVTTGMLAADYRLLAHNQVTNTLSPGLWALMEIAGWPHRCLDNCDQDGLCLQSSPGATDASSRLQIYLLDNSAFHGTKSQ